VSARVGCSVRVGVAVGVGVGETVMLTVGVALIVGVSVLVVVTVDANVGARAEVAVGLMTASVTIAGAVYTQKNVARARKAIARTVAVSRREYLS
jgi:hypothetical protein